MWWDFKIQISYIVCVRERKKKVEGLYEDGWESDCVQSKERKKKLKTDLSHNALSIYPCCCESTCWTSPLITLYLLLKLISSFSLLLEKFDHRFLQTMTSEIRSNCLLVLPVSFAVSWWYEYSHVFLSVLRSQNQVARSCISDIPVVVWHSICFKGELPSTTEIIMYYKC